jgi:hypothetical protein
MFKNETAPNYIHIVCNIGHNRRVIVCKDGLQWIIQSSEGFRGGRRRWTGKSYVTSRNKLIELCRRLDGFSEQVHLPILLGLSEIVGEQPND